ncbi:protein FAR1-RELATED SEQUENCE 5-like [Amborella trichopoda]|uniref:protein FAR1-RELATED SEQUENCE 5-like n=1 Tax=Amborella trichopoda TaxID=13333 RepID=UPI0005D40EA4|nr:protein FAR1-RELATED SEQUENCE 5-like [Amborella trichopoda]|eukprot:XP_011622736.1 protein FAR1-RELATED SEQUENCE 5-like [Amborella trichopoda]
MDLTISKSVASPTWSENDNMGNPIESTKQDPLLATPPPNKYTNLENGEHVLSSKAFEIERPRIGMKFSDENDVYEFYKAFALVEGFGIRKGSTHTNKDGKRIDREYKCSKEGFRMVKQVQPRKIVPETWCGCDANMCISTNANNEWVVTKFVKDHNHLLVSPHKARLIRSH